MQKYAMVHRSEFGTSVFLFETEHTIDYRHFMFDQEDEPLPPLVQYLCDELDIDFNKFTEEIDFINVTDDCEHIEIPNFLIHEL